VHALLGFFGKITFPGNGNSRHPPNVVHHTAPAQVLFAEKMPRQELGRWRHFGSLGASGGRHAELACYRSAKTCPLRARRHGPGNVALWNSANRNDGFAAALPADVGLAATSDAALTRRVNRALPA
jgi:hypothetical protein